MAIDAAAITHNIDQVRERIAGAAKRSHRSADEVTLIAVSKTFPPEAIRAAYAAGLRHFGENRVQELQAKKPELADLPATWHLIGHLQSNKVRRAAEYFDRVDSIDSLPLAQKLNEAAAALNKRLGVLIEVHLGEVTKTGVPASELNALVQSATSLSHLDLLGLMTIPFHSDQPDSARPHFRKLRVLRDEAAQAIGRALPVLSMGMSDDFQIAIEEGSTEVRIGRALFGGRG
jgi:hypothetical protein